MFLPVLLSTLNPQLSTNASPARTGIQLPRATRAGAFSLDDLADLIEPP